MSKRQWRKSRGRAEHSDLNKMERRMLKYDGYSGMRPEQEPEPELVKNLRAHIRNLDKQVEPLGYRVMIEKIPVYADGLAGLDCS